MSADLDNALAELQRAIDYRFADHDRLLHALTHSSYPADSKTDTPHNERLEFLGDAVLGLVAARALFDALPGCPEGRLTKVKARLVSAANLEIVARGIPLGKCLRLGRAEEVSGGREKKGLLVDALEALIAAIYLDGGLAPAARFIQARIITPESIAATDSNLDADNAKSALQELLQRRGEPLPSYRVAEEIGPPHQRLFRVEIAIADRFRAQAEASTKKEAEQRAALEALNRRDDWLPADATDQESRA